MLRLILFIISFAVGIYILQSEQLHDLIFELGAFDLIGVFIAGFFFVMTFTVVPAAAVLIAFTDVIHPLPLSLVAGIGGVCGDYILWRFFRGETDQLLSEATLRNHLFLKRVMRLGIVHWLGPLIGAIIIASPFPDEIGIALLGITKLETKRFLALVFVLDTIGIFLIVTISHLFY